MKGHEKKKITIKGRVLSIIIGVAVIVYWMIGKAENVIESLYQDY